jgi:hypothetical protein
MTNAKHPSLDVTAANGVPFRVVLLLDGKSVNFPAASAKFTSLWGTEPLVEFYDARYRNVRGFTPDGQFVSRYYLETLLGRDEQPLSAGKSRRYGLDLQGDVPNWTIDATTMRTVGRWLRTEAAPYQRAEYEVLVKKHVLVRDRLSELLPGHSINPQGNSISIEAAAVLLDIIEGLKSEVARLQAFLPPIDESSVDL